MDGRRVQVSTSEIAPGGVRAVEVDGAEYVLWRGLDGRVRGVPRTCPHLDHDLAEGHVDGDELVCPGHAWAFDGAGHAFKRNEFGRVDPKGSVEVLTIREADGNVEVELG